MKSVQDALAVQELRKPTDDELDVYGLRHPGKGRKTNQDHLLIGSLRKQVLVHLTSLPDLAQLPVVAERLAFPAMVAAGAGGSAAGETASRLAVAAVTRYVASGMQCYYAAAGQEDAASNAAPPDAAMKCHDELLAMGQEQPELAGMATTLTLWLGLWRRAYLLQVGDSRCSQRRADPDLPRSDQGPGAGGRRRACTRGSRPHPQGAHPLERHRSPAIGADRDPPRSAVGQRRTPLQRRAHELRAR